MSLLLDLLDLFRARVGETVWKVGCEVLEVIASVSVFMMFGLVTPPADRSCENGSSKGSGAKKQSGMHGG